MKMTSAQAAKKLKKLNDQHEMLLSMENKARTFTAAIQEDVESVRPPYEVIPADDELMKIAKSYDKPYEQIVEQILGANRPEHELFDRYKRIYKAMDDWVVVKTDENNENIAGFLMRKNQGENRIETIDWM